MADKRLDELVRYIAPVDVSLFTPPESETYARYRRELIRAIGVDCVTEDCGASDPNREEVRRLRLEGRTLNEISKRTGIPQEQAEIYCRQLGLPLEGSCRLCTDVNMEQPRQTCANCGGPLTGKSRKYCCRHCKDVYTYRERKRKRVRIENETYS